MNMHVHTAHSRNAAPQANHTTEAQELEGAAAIPGGGRAISDDVLF
jgi:hypothetical protein